LKKLKLLLYNGLWKQPAACEEMEKLGTNGLKIGPLKELATIERWFDPSQQDPEPALQARRH
jgi:hypothetical protein